MIFELSWTSVLFPKKCLKYLGMRSSKLKCACCSIRGDKAEIFFLRSDSISLIKQLNSIAIDQTISAGMPICNVCRKKANKVKLDESKIY